MKLSAGDFYSTESILEVHRLEKGEDADYKEGLAWVTRGAAQLAFRIVRNGAELDVVAPVPAQRKILLQRGVFVSGLLLAAPPNAVPERPVINVQYVERASLGEEASVRYYDVIHSIDGKIIRAYEDVLQALEGKDGQDLDFVLRREIPRERDAYNYLVRRLEIDRVIQIDEKGLIR